MSDTTGWTFKDGRKFPAGKPRSSGCAPHKVMESKSSNGLTKYLTILWDDGVITCDCRGWSILKKDNHGQPKPRTCKHCKKAAENNNAAMTLVDAFQPAGLEKRTQLDFSVRQLRRVNISRRNST